MSTNTKILKFSVLSEHAKLIESHLTPYCNLDPQFSSIPFITSCSSEFLAGYCPEAQDLPATLIIHETTDETLLAIHIREDLVTLLDSHPRLSDLLSRRDGINGFLILTEEISHFHHYIRNAAAGEPVSRFDLELQAELDKIIVGSLVLTETYGHSHINELTQLLFDESSFHGSLTEYAQVSRIAEKFWKDHLKILGKNLIYDARFRRLLQMVARRNGNEKKRLLNTLIQAA